MSIYVIPSEIEAEAMQATPHAELIAQVMNPCVPKTEREWAAQREIERLRNELKADRTLNRITCEMDEACCQCRQLRDEIEQLQARVAELETYACGVRCPNCDNLRLELGEQRRRATELERDAARYRWVRGDAPSYSERWSRWNID